MLYSDPSEIAAEQRAAMTLLRSRGVAKVVVHFSGGNDSGGADSWEYFDADGKEVDVPNGNASRRQVYDKAKGGWSMGPWQVYDKGVEREATSEEIRWSRVAEVMERPIYERWGSFAGEFEVDGTVTWDVLAGDYKITGQESTTVWRDIT